MGLDAETRETVARAAELHDVGKVAVPDAILSKPGPLDHDEEAFMRRHTVIGESIIAEAPALREVAALVRASHERWDGTGYPGRPGRPRDPARRADRLRLRRLLRDAPAPPLRRRARRGGGARRAAPRRGSQFDPALVAAFCVLRGSSGGSGRFIRAARLEHQPAQPAPEPAVTEAA